ncbi:DUF397 domain-containing protein [Salinispora arenicola]|uniref:Uncharacterized protein DUF397 n=1 Tax=Salinispora arenicola TaxID=168697 RepID=A0A542XLA2_SALAC|nr:DUF397 domain-containing protein [Salinispora arenicola]MCN0154964.1 DUF397 domain-containing protein [Salinispora arenicola]MCN0181006.1 DUF397 domain-containing protein [Salinispora arenicola]NIL43602.1 DUF397 domain-containing protein [Salinispora arenicola]NIL59351.1 DUF397 domain-containing protein [Salinispora arenicola]NIL63573.1 DUF397 domain-containing protein [Salinispora arenicola]
MNDLPGVIWRSSSRSNDQGLCVEVADNLVDVLGVVAVRDSKDRSGPALAVGRPGWAAFVRAVRAGELDS